MIYTFTLLNRLYQKLYSFTAWQRRELWLELYASWKKMNPRLLLLFFIRHLCRTGKLAENNNDRSIRKFNNGKRIATNFPIRLRITSWIFIQVVWIFELAHRILRIRLLGVKKVKLSYIEMRVANTWHEVTTLRTFIRNTSFREKAHRHER